MLSFLRLCLALLCLTLPYSAAALADGEDCHEHQPAVAEQAAVPVEAAGAAREHSASAHQAGAHEDCDCGAQCGCPQHCTGSCAAAMPGFAAADVSPSAYAFVTSHRALPESRQNNLFRPPIATLH